MAGSLSQHCIEPIGACAAGVMPWRFKGELRVTAVVKATFGFANDAAMPRVAPKPIVEEAVHHAGNPMRSIVAASDLPPFRRRADVVFTGHAHAPAGGAAESVEVRLGVASGDRVVLDKRLVVRKKGGFSRIPLLYEHAAGGPDHPENPHGEEEGSNDLNILDPRDPTRPAGFAPIARWMPERQRLLARGPLPKPGPRGVEIPDGFDFDFFQTAPADQQIGYLRGDEWLLFENLHPTRPFLRMYLPGARALARIHGLSAFGIPEGRALAMSADGLHVLGDEESCVVIWRGSFAVAREEALDALRIVAGVELPGEPMAWPEVVGPARPRVETSAARPAQGIDETLPLPSSAPRAPPLPFRAPGPAESAAALIAQGLARRAAAMPVHGSGGETLPIPSRLVRDSSVDPLPFNRGTSVEERPQPAPPPDPVVVIEAAPPPKKMEGSPWAPAPPAPEIVIEPAPQKKRIAPKVDVNNKLYGTKKKG